MTLTGKDVRIGACVYAGDMDRMVRFYRDTLGFHTEWDGGDFAEFETASGVLSLFMYSRKRFVKAIGEEYSPPRGINQTFEIALWLPRFADVDAEYERLLKLGYSFPPEHPSPMISASATSMWPTRRAICWRSAAQAKHNGYNKGMNHELGTMDRLLSNQ